MNNNDICKWENGVCRRGRLLIEKGNMPADGYYGCCGDPESVIHPVLNISMPKNPYARKCDYLGANGCTIEWEPCRLWFCDVALKYKEEF